MIVRQLELDPSLLGIARYATISRPFQYATERILFHEISVDCYKLKGVPHLTSHRLSALREVQYSISFPQALLKQKLAARNNLNRRNIKTALDTRTQEDGDDDDDDGGRERPFPDDNSLEPENEASKSIRNEILTKEIRRMFGFLKTLTFPNSQPVYLRLLVCPPKPPAFAIQSSSKWKRIHTSYEEVRYSNSYLNIGDITDLPVITRINAVHFAGVSSRFIHPQGLLRIASKLAGLETLTLPFNDKPYRSEGDRRERRYR